MTEENRNISNAISNNKPLIIAVTAVVLIVVFMYFRDQRQQRAYELRRLEQRVELLEEWGRPRQNSQSMYPPPASKAAEVVKIYNSLDLMPNLANSLDVVNIIQSRV